MPQQLAPFALVSLMATLPLAALPLQVDFGNSSQPTTEAGWNNMSATTGNDPADLTDLVSSDGTPTSIGLAYATSGADSGAAGTGANYAGPYPPELSSLPASALQDGLFFQSDSITLTFTGLDPVASYDLTLYGARGNNGTGATFSATGANTATDDLANTFNNAAHVAFLGGLRPNASGELTLQMERNGSGSSALNLLILEAAEEEEETPNELGPPNPNLDPARPNVLILYYDDLGYSNVGAYDTSQTSYTPNLDALTNSGLRFDAGHSGDAVCTPSRYGLLTGRYCWRTRLKTRVTGGYSSPLIDPERLTMPKMFQELGYATSMIGKWHIGMQFYSPDGEPVNLGNDANVLGSVNNSVDDDKIDFSRPLTQTPTSYGFDYFFGTSASLDMPPYAWIENETVLYRGGLVSRGRVEFGLATPVTNANLQEGEPIGAVNNVRDGAYDPTFVVSDYLQVQAQKVADQLLTHSRDGEPFFIYVPFPSPHLPWAVQSTFDGTTPFAYGDFLAQSDHYAGQILDALADPDGDPSTEDGLDGNTVVFFSSDNGVSRSAMGQGLGNNHDGNGPFRGQKLDNWEGGTRVPFVIRWPGVTTAGSTTDHTCWQGDFFATMAEYLRYDFTPDEAADAESFLPVLRGDPMPAERRPAITQHAYNGQLAILDKDGIWKLIDGTGGNGSNSYDANNVNIPASEASGEIFGTPRQLFNLSTDIGETNNLLPSTDPEILAKEQELYALLNEIRGNTTYGTDGDSNVPPIDSDADGVPNYFENEVEGLDRDNPADGALDFDGDGLDNRLEFENQADPLDPDTDKDDLSDDLEVLTYFSAPNSAHSDSDGLPDGEEVHLWNTDPVRDDTDGDGFDDQLELANFTNPRNADSLPTTGAPVTLALDPSSIQLVGSTGDSDDPAVLGSWDDSGTLYVRERSAGGSNQQFRTRLFLKFDLNAVEGTVTDARLKVYQTHRLNDIHSASLEVARVTEDWDSEPGSFPLFDDTPVTDNLVFGSNSDFGTAVDASGFYGGSPGSPGDETGFDPDNQITSIVQGWQNGSLANHGLRIAFEAPALVGAAFADSDDPTTTVDESLQLLVTYVPIENEDSDGDQLKDDYEIATFGDLSQSGSGDFDGDGYTNLAEWALGSDPLLPSALPKLSLQPTDGAFSYHRIINAGLGFRIELSEDLTTWRPFTDYYQFSMSNPPSDLGSHYEKALLTPTEALPETLFYQILIEGVR
ncbi:MAG: sulfatase-like hydrolase/transferase [Verrucomicrobiota bacterium JB023]|nr:sulfatase-like hydrolase/transferase [Verrucomicrobiota bacterium JB023]